MSLAKELAEPDNELGHYEKEARQRSAVSRAYYAIFCTARDIFWPEHMYGPPQEGSSHAKLWKSLKKDPNSKENRYIGEHASRLGESRRKADYEGYIVDLPDLVEDAIEEAEELKEALEGL